ncbi:tyrosine decarboxylase MfnA [Paenibacillus thailandensis]|uniref:Tyrosine decarboxylase MfnA n=1 Tax=Paenibacillus thailandensis TaxID=393250 RepID=A0ABW5R370_9BACL
MREHGLDKDSVLQNIEDHLAKDAAWNKVLNSICTEPLAIGKEAFIRSIDTNLGDVRIFRGSSELEHKAVRLLASLLGGGDSPGNIVSGGTEANVLALLAAKKRRPDIASPEIIIPETAHFSLFKAIHLMGLQYRIAKVDSRFKADPASIEALINDNTVAILATAGTSELGSVDPIEAIAQVALRHRVYLHVDAATGGFIIPFARKLGMDLPAFDFTLEGVCSITVDPHKYGLAPIPAGGILFRDRHIQQLVSVDSYFMGIPGHMTMLGTRNGAGAAAAYAVMEHLGLSGYMEITERNFELTRYLVRQLKDRGLRLPLEPELNIVLFEMDGAAQFLRYCEERGWIVSVSKRFPDAVRIVIQRHVTHGMINQFLSLLDRFVEDRKSAGAAAKGVPSS